MLDTSTFQELVAEIVAQGYARATAVEYAAWIGDTPEYDEKGDVLVKNQYDEVLATLKPLKVFAES